jgi:hypothetical protein
MEGFPSKRNVCNQITRINLGNFIERQSTHLHGKEIDELCSVGRARGENELVGCGIQQPISQVARFVCTNKTQCK